MNNPNNFRRRVRRVTATVAFAIAAFVILAPSAVAASWNNIEPLKSRRADVERALGYPVENAGGEARVLEFKVAGGRVQVAFVDARFVASKKLRSELEGTVRQIVLVHDNSSDTPESMNLPKNSAFTKEDVKDGVIYRNLKEGIVYTFIGGKLKSTYYVPSSEQWAHARKG